MISVVTNFSIIHSKMLKRLVALCTLKIFLISLVTAKVMYNLVHEKAELLAYNETLAKNVQFSFKKINRTSTAFNTSFVILTDIMDNKALLDIQIDKLFGTEYKKTGTSLSLNLCKAYKSNIFGIVEQLHKNGNLVACDIKKGKYYTTNFVPDQNMFPTFLPFGSYRVVLNIHHPGDVLLFKMNWFARVEQLVKW